jgi:hypothetical protein
LQGSLQTLVYAVVAAYAEFQRRWRKACRATKEVVGMARTSLIVDQDATYQTCTLMGSGPRIKFGTTDQQDATPDGIPRWELQVAVTYRPEFEGQRPEGEVIAVTIPSLNDPADGIQVPAYVVFDQLRVGLMAPEKGEGDRIRGGRLFYKALAVRAAVPARVRGES